MKSGIGKGMTRIDHPNMLGKEIFRNVDMSNMHPLLPHGPYSYVTKSDKEY